MTLARDRFRFAVCGEDVTVYEWVRILDPERIEMGSHVIIDDFVFIDGGGGVSIGSHVHIASFASLTGGGSIVLEDYVGISGGSRLVSGTDRFDGSGLTGPTIPERWRSVERGRIKIEKHSVLGTNVVVHPGVTDGAGVIVGSNSLVTGDLPPWTICHGVPAKPVRERPRETILEYEHELEKHERTTA